MIHVLTVHWQNPKWIAIQRTEELALAFARPLRVFFLVASLAVLQIFFVENALAANGIDLNLSFFLALTFFAVFEDLGRAKSLGIDARVEPAAHGEDEIHGS